MRRTPWFLASLLGLLAAGLAGAQYGDISDLKIDRPEDKVGVKSVPPPRGAIVLFDGTNLDAWSKVNSKAKAPWKLVEVHGKKVMQAGGGNIVTRQKFAGHFKLHVEFRVPYEPKNKDQNRGNSGVYLQGRYEVQILDSYHNPTYAKGGCGAIYGIADPLKKAYKAPTVWQSYDIDYHAPKCENGKPVEPARVTVYQNGILIHDNVKIPLNVHSTTAGLGGDTCKPGPIMLQDHGHPVQFRNIWLVQLSGEGK